MGLLDLISGGGTGGGLLDFLRNNAANQQFGSGLQSDQAQYGTPMIGTPQPAQSAPQYARLDQPNALDTAQWPAGPVGAPSQANAQMQPSPAPPMLNPPSMPNMPGRPDFGDRLMLGTKGFIGNLNNGPIGAFAGGVGALITGQPTDPGTIEAQKNSAARNVTAQALLARGVDPATVQAAVANPELMKTVIAQTYGAKQVQPLGNGYIYNPKSNKVERAYEPDDKIPVGFEKTDNGLRPIAGGPADPAYLRAKTAGETDPNAVKVLGKGGELYKVGSDGQPVIVHKNEDGAEATLDDPTVKAMAAQYLAGDKSVLQNLGRGAQGAANIVKIRQEITQQAQNAGLNAKDIVNNFNEQAGNLAGQRSIGTRAANISLAANEANNMIPIALKASEAVPRGEWMPWNKMVQAYQTGTSSPELARFVAATNSLVNAYVRAVSPSGVPTDSMREHAYSMLNSAQSAKAYQAVTSIMQDEMKAALQAPEQVRKELRHEDKPAETPAGAPKAGNYIWMPGKGLVPKE